MNGCSSKQFNRLGAGGRRRGRETAAAIAMVLSDDGFILCPPGCPFILASLPGSPGQAGKVGKRPVRLAAALRPGLAGGCRSPEDDAPPRYRFCSPAALAGWLRPQLGRLPGYTPRRSRIATMDASRTSHPMRSAACLAPCDVTPDICPLAPTTAGGLRSLYQSLRPRAAQAASCCG